MDDNPFANPFADDADPTANPFADTVSAGAIAGGSGIHSPALASYTSGFDSTSRRASIVSAASAERNPPHQPETEESPYIRKLERDGVISGITSPSAAFQQNPFSAGASTFTRSNHDDVDAFKGGFYSPPAFIPVNPLMNQHQGFAIGESALEHGRSDAENRHGDSPSRHAAQHTQQDDLEALGLAPAEDPTSSLKAAFIKHTPRTAQTPSEPPNPNGSEETDGAKLTNDTESPKTTASTNVPPSSLRKSTSRFTGDGISAGARRRKKVVGISVDNVERERERERERAAKDRVEREAARKEQAERDAVERGRLEKEGVGKGTQLEAASEESKETEIKDSTDAPSNAPTAETKPIISPTTAEQILLSADPRQTAQAIAQQMEHNDGPSDDLSKLPPLPSSEGNTRTATPEPVPADSGTTASPLSHSTAALGSPSRTAHQAHAHSGVIRSHLDPVVTSPLDGGPGKDDAEDAMEPKFQALALGASSTITVPSGNSHPVPSQEPAPHGRSSCGRAFEEEDLQASIVQSPITTAEGPASAGWTTDLPSGSVDRGTGWGSPGGEQGGADAWGSGPRNDYSQSPETPIRPTATRPLSAVSIKSPPLTASAPPLPPKSEPPAFTIRIHDPTRVGDPIRGHVVYTVTTRTTSPHYSARESSVLRRFSQFLWLVERVGANNPGVIVPPVPDKQLSGRFEDQFIETRRAALEKCLNKMANHPVLSLDPDLRLFLESESFEFEVKHRKHETAQSQESKGLLATIGGSIGGPRFVEKDDWFEQKKTYLDSVESQIKGWIKSVEGASKHRLDLSLAISEFSDSITALAESDLSMELSQALQRLAGLTLREKETQENQAKMDVVYLLNTADEYVRWIGSVRLAFASRIKSYFTWQHAEADVRRLKVQHEKLRRSGKIAHDRIQPALAEIAEADRKALDAHSDFDAVSRLVKMEFSRYEQDRVEEFKHMFERYLDEMIVAQKEMIGAWENYLAILQRTTGDRPTQRSS